MSGGKKIRDFPCLRVVTENEFKKNERTIYQSSIFKKREDLGFISQESYFHGSNKYSRKFSYYLIIPSFIIGPSTFAEDLVLALGNTPQLLW